MLIQEKAKSIFENLKSKAKLLVMKRFLQVMGGFIGLRNLQTCHVAVNGEATSADTGSRTIYRYDEEII